MVVIFTFGIRHLVFIFFKKYIFILLRASFHLQSRASEFVGAALLTHENRSLLFPFYEFLVRPIQILKSEIFYRVLDVFIRMFVQFELYN